VKRSFAEKKQKGEVATQEGRLPMSFEGYKLVALKLLQIKPASNSHNKGNAWLQSMFAWPFFVLQWNLMSRSKSSG
jgi:hypothetical protein